MARAGNKYDPQTGPRDRWMAEHPFRPDWVQEEQARQKGLHQEIPANFRGGPSPFRGRGGRGRGRGGRGESFKSLKK